MYVPTLARSNSGFMSQEGSNNREFASQGKSSPTLLSVTRTAENGTSVTRTRNKESNGTTEYKGTKKPTSPVIIYPVKGNQNLDGYSEYIEEKAGTSRNIMNIPMDLWCCSDCTFRKSTVSIVQKLWGDDCTSCPFQEIFKLRINLLLKTEKTCCRYT